MDFNAVNTDSISVAEPKIMDLDQLNAASGGSPGETAVAGAFDVVFGVIGMGAGPVGALVGTAVGATIGSGLYYMFVGQFEVQKITG